ncbi:MAG: flagellar biosynthesis anti-sigma factor FlgM [Burkholderiales bacterium]|nr:flagellar biosynthesis anti-sigma factor FlgM [Burkholderiales bacterium]
MKIDSTGKPLGTTLSRTDSRSTGKAASASTDTGTSQSDSVDVNTFTSRLQALSNSLSTQPVVDEAKVAEIRQAIAEGRFTIRPDAIADQLVRNVKDMLSKN